jgi:starch synthase
VLVPIDQLDDGTGTPVHPDTFVADLAAALTAVATDSEGAARMGEAARRRVEEHFAWDAIGEQTLAVYRSVLG